MLKNIFAKHKTSNYLLEFIFSSIVSYLIGYYFYDIYIRSSHSTLNTQYTKILLISGCIFTFVIASVMQNWHERFISDIKLQHQIKNKHIISGLKYLFSISFLSGSVYLYTYFSIELLFKNAINIKEIIELFTISLNNLYNNYLYAVVLYLFILFLLLQKKLLRRFRYIIFSINIFIMLRLWYEFATIDASEYIIDKNFILSYETLNLILYYLLSFIFVIVILSLWEWFIYKNNLSEFNCPSLLSLDNKLFIDLIRIIISQIIFIRTFIYLLK